MKTIKDYIINESDLDKDSKIKNQFCIDLIKVIGKDNVEKLSSDDNGSVWKIKLKGTNAINLIELSKEIVKIDNDKKYNCIKQIWYGYDIKTITVS